MGILTLDEAVRHYLIEVKNAARSRKTLRMYEDNLRLFREFSPGEDCLTGPGSTHPGRFGDRPVDSFDRSDVAMFFGALDSVRCRLSRDVRKDRIGQPVSAVTRHAYARSLRAFWRWCFEAELIERPVKIVMPKVPMKEIVILTDDEIERLLATAKKCSRDSIKCLRDYILVLLLAHGGMRRGEVLHLKLDDVCLERTPPSLLIRCGKGAKDRRTVIAPDIRRELARYCLKLRTLGIDWLIFSDRTPNKSLDENSPNRILQRLAVEAGVDPKRVHCHAFRHSFCSRLANSSVNLVTVMTLAGHTDLSTTKRYVHTTEQAMEDALIAAPLNGKTRR